MSQTSIHTFFKNRKRSATECIQSPGKLIAKNLFALNDGSSSPIRSPVRESCFREKPSEEHESIGPVFEHLEITKSVVSTPSSSVGKVLKKKPTVLEEFKESVRNHTKYFTLKAALKKFNSTVSHLDVQTFENSSQRSDTKYATLKAALKKFNSTVSHLDVKTFGNSSQRSDSTEPCFVRFKHLVVVSPDVLALPPKYATLEDIFNGVETVVRALMNRREIVTFNRIQNDVQNLIRRKFTVQHLGMIQTVYPGAYEIRYEIKSLSLTRDESLEMIIEESKSGVTDINERRKIFRELLLERTKLHHQEFLKNLEPPIIVPLHEVRRWHPLFDLDDVPSISPTPIPLPRCHKNASNSTENIKDVVVLQRNIDSNAPLPETGSKLCSTKVTREDSSLTAKVITKFLTHPSYV